MEMRGMQRLVSTSSGSILSFHCCCYSYCLLQNKKNSTSGWYNLSWLWKSEVICGHCDAYREYMLYRTAPPPASTTADIPESPCISQSGQSKLVMCASWRRPSPSLMPDVKCPLNHAISNSTWTSTFCTSMHVEVRFLWLLLASISYFHKWYNSSSVSICW